MNWVICVVIGFFVLVFVVYHIVMHVLGHRTLDNSKARDRLKEL